MRASRETSPRRPAAARVLVLAAIALAPARRAHAESAPGPDVPAVQKVLLAQKMEGWLLTDFRGANPIAQEVVHPNGHQTRRWFYLIPARGEPVALVPRLEASTFAAVPGRKIPFSSWREMEASLRGILRGRRQVAMEYSPRGQMATLSRVDAGTVELVRSMGVRVVPSAPLVQAIESRWTPAGRESHLRAARAIERVKDEAFDFVARRLREGRPVTEWDVSSRIQKALDMRGFEAGSPIVATGVNAADPHYNVSEATASAIQAGDLLLVDVVAKAKEPGAICADQTWMAFAGAQVPARAAQLFALVRDARDAALRWIEEGRDKKRTMRGFEVDGVAREVIRKGGYGAAFIHRTGHSIDTHCHGDGANLDDYETHDDRPLVPGIGFSIEPGIYLPGEIGIRSEIDVYYGEDGVEVTTAGVQREIKPLLDKPAEPPPAEAHPGAGPAPAAPL